MSAEKWDILSAWLSGNATEEQMHLVKKRMKEDASFKKTADEMYVIWNTRNKKMPVFNADRAFEKLTGEINPSYTRRNTETADENRTEIEEGKVVLFNWKKLAGIAASIILMVTAGWFGYNYFTAKNDTPSFVTITTQPGERKQISMVDGSIVWLNGNSELKYDETMKVRFRMVDLKGEGYFKVAKNVKQPFVVTAGGAIIKVLGTEFTISVEMDFVTAAVVEGKVSVADKDVIDPENMEASKGGVLLTANQKAVVDVDANTTVASSVDAAAHASWKDGKLIFKNQPIETIAEQLSRFYGKDVQAAKSLKGLRFTGTFEDQPLEQVLQLITESLRIKYKTINNSMLLYN